MRAGAAMQQEKGGCLPGGVTTRLGRFMRKRSNYDIVVVGGGHAGIEAASAAARMGCKTVLVTMSIESIGRLSCNPAIGGMAKGQLVREIDALGGEMARIADASGIQFKMLGRSKGPAMWSPRSQNDKDIYPRVAQQRLLDLGGLDLIEDSILDVAIEDCRVRGVILARAGEIRCSVVVVCSGTFLSGRMHVGLTSQQGGRVGEPSAESLTGALQSVGIRTGRLKTGTPPRVDRDSIDFGHCTVDHGDVEPVPFSRSTKSVQNEISCFFTETSDATHSVLRRGFDRSPMFTGRIQGTGPRYCPSIEDKIHRFPDRSSHQIFLEPEGVGSRSVYVNGFSTSLPEDVQVAGLQTMPALARCRILRFGYAVEYDYFPSYQLDATLHSKGIQGLFFAGQVNGTSGYEEAAAQGLVAGINAALWVMDDEPLILDRSGSYIGVLLDDLANLMIEEPYRMFTSRAEYRLLLRQDNADLRLTAMGARIGLVPRLEAERVEAKRERVRRGREILEGFPVEPGPGRPNSETTKAWQLLKRPECGVADVRSWLGGSPRDIAREMVELLDDPQVAEQLSIGAMYDGYIQRQLDEVDRFSSMERARIPISIDYSRMQSLSSEAREKLSLIRPRSLGQASRIAGVSRSDIGVLTLYVR